MRDATAHNVAGMYIQQRLWNAKEAILEALEQAEAFTGGTEYRKARKALALLNGTGISKEDA